MTEHARVCKRHQKACTTDRRDNVVCPVGPHNLEEGQWVAGQVEAGQTKVTLEGEDLVQARAEGALRFTSQDRGRAISHLYGLTRHDHRLREALTDPLLEWACTQAIDRARGKLTPEAPPVAAVPRVETSRPGRPVGSTNKPRESKPDRARSDRGLQLVAEANLRDLMGFTLPTGKTLGVSTGAEIREAAFEYSDAARGSAVRARWLRLVAEAIPADKQARWAIDEARLGRIYGQAELDMERLGELLRPAKLSSERPAIGGSR